ncbi:PstC family ABC transporter permease [uncultured Desulfovibrio sp.]|uniref:PstC family ABC transporter permease n=1 Tax=uncultured Desulfovibrio sp. TaxID=167968 RepID=UPI00272B5465|nr:ABC transporter permease subunit [uncultured Desulfovibrio sp.]
MRRNREHTGRAVGEATAFPAAPASLAARSPEAACGCPAREPGEGAGWGTRLAALLAVCGVGLLFVMVVAAALPVLLRPGPGWPLEWLWQPYEGHFGILPMCLGSLALATFALCAGWPLALGLCCWLLTEEARAARPLARLTGGLIRFMTTIPTVVYGFAAVFLLTPLVRTALGGTGMCLFAAGVMLTLLILPTMVLVLEAGLAPRLERLCPWGQALGFSRLDLLRLFVLPKAGRNLAAAAVLGFGRAVGDTLIPLMLAGNATHVPGGLTESLRTLTAHMALVTANEVGGAAYNSLFVAGLVLLLVNAGASLALRRLGARSGTRGGAGS